MIRHRRNPAEREYPRASYEKNHICFSMAMALHTIAVGVNLAISWVLGAVIDAIGNGNMDELFNVLWIMLVITVGMVLVDISGYGAKFHFIRRALVQYKAPFLYISPSLRARPRVRMLFSDCQYSRHSAVPSSCIAVTSTYVRAHQPG